MQKLLQVSLIVLILATGVEAMDEAVMRRAFLYVEQECLWKTRHTTLELCLLRWSHLDQYCDVPEPTTISKTGLRERIVYKKPDTVTDYFYDYPSYKHLGENQSLFKHEDGGWSMEAGGQSELMATVFALGAVGKESATDNVVSEAVSYIMARRNKEDGWWNASGKNSPESSLDVTLQVFEALTLARRYKALLSRKDRSMLEHLADELGAAMLKRKDETSEVGCLRPSSVALYICGLNHLKYGDSVMWVKWLEDHQNADGGWGEMKDGHSDLLATCYVMMALCGYEMGCLPDETVLTPSCQVDADGVVLLEHGQNLSISWNADYYDLIQISLIDSEGKLVNQGDNQYGGSAICSTYMLLEGSYEVVISDWEHNFSKLRGERYYTLKMNPWHEIHKVEFMGWNANGLFYPGRNVTLSPLFAVQGAGNEATEGTLTGTIRASDGSMVHAYEPIHASISAGNFSLGLSFPEITLMFDKAGIYTLNVTFTVKNETCEKTLRFTVHEPRTLDVENRLEPEILDAEEKPAKVIMNVSVWTPDSEETIPVSFGNTTVKEIDCDTIKITVEKLVNRNGHLIQEGQLIVQTEFGNSRGGLKVEQYTENLTLHPIIEGKCELLYRPDEHVYSSGTLLQLHSGVLEGEELHLKSHIGNVFVPLSGHDPIFDVVPY